MADSNELIAGSKYVAGLYIVATPIGNLGDITLRALEVLKGADIILCEDTRVSYKLFSHYGISGKLLSYNDHNAPKMRPKIINAIRNGSVVALVSDAGTPLISDPGYKLVRDLQQEGLPLTVVPGASSLTAALCIAGLPTHRVLFEGFLPSKEKDRKACFLSYQQLDATIVIFERAERLLETLKDMAVQLDPSREIAVAREITKKFEEVRRGTLSELIEAYQQEESPKGEVVLLISPAVAAHPAAFAARLDEALGDMLVEHRLKEAVEMASAMFKDIPKKDIYARALELKKNGSI